MPDIRIKVAVFPRGITVFELSHFVADGFPDSLGGTA